MMYCEKCGSQMLDEAKFCPKCGAKVNDEEIEDVVLVTNPADIQEENLSISKRLGLICVCLVGLAALYKGIDENNTLLAIVSGSSLGVLISIFNTKAAYRYTWAFVVCIALVLFYMIGYSEEEKEKQVTTTESKQELTNTTNNSESRAESDSKKTSESSSKDSEMADEGYKMGMMLAAADDNGEFAQLIELVDNIDDANLSAKIDEQLDRLAENIYDQYYRQTDKYKSSPDENRLKAIYKKNVIKGLKDFLQSRR